MASPKDHVPIPESELPALPQTSVIGGVNPNEVAEVTVFVRAGRSAAPIGSVLDQIAENRIADRQYLTRSALAANHGADATDLEAIARFASKNNLSVSAISAGQRTVRLLGKLSDLSKAFNVQLATYRSSRGVYRAHAGPVHIPAELADTVIGVFGLDTTKQSDFRLRMRPRQAKPLAGAALPGFTPIEVANLYGFPPGLNGQGQCVGIIEFGGGYRMEDL